MEDFSCEINEGKRFKTGPCLYERHKVTKGNRTCSECGYYKSYLSPTKIKISGPRGKSPRKTHQKKNVTKLEDLIRGKLYILESQQKNFSTGKPKVEYLYLFTEKMRDDFRKILKDYDKEKIESFIYRIESDIGNLVSAKRALGGEQRSHIRDVKDMIKSLERANEYLLKIYSGHIGFLFLPKHSYSYKFENPDDPLSIDLYEEVNACCKIKSKTVLRLLQNLIQDLKSAVSIEGRKRGEHHADTDDLAYQVARWFEKFIGSPRPCSGPYPKIVRKCFEIYDCNCENDRIRAIRYALRKLAQS